MEKDPEQPDNRDEETDEIRGMVDALTGANRKPKDPEKRKDGYTVPPDWAEK